MFDDEYYRTVESEFASALREGGERPFLHLMHLPNQVDDIVRGVAMHYILERLGVDYHDEESECPKWSCSSSRGRRWRSPPTR